jgi:transcriptional regulator with XRE-family HTH domain
MTQTTDAVIPQFTVGDRLRKARELTGLDQGAFAEEIGVSRGTVSNYESGATRPKKVVLLAWSMRTAVPRLWLELGIVPEDIQLAAAPPLLTNPDSSSGISASPGHVPVDNDITRLRKRIPIAPALALVLRIAA